MCKKHFIIGTKNEDQCPLWTDEERATADRRRQVWLHSNNVSSDIATVVHAWPFKGANHTLRVQGVGYPGMRRDSPNKHIIVCNECLFETPARFPWQSDCPQFGMSQDELRTVVGMETL